MPSKGIRMLLLFAFMCVQKISPIVNIIIVVISFYHTLITFEFTIANTQCQRRAQQKYTLKAPKEIVIICLLSVYFKRHFKYRYYLADNSWLAGRLGWAVAGHVLDNSDVK